MVASIPPSRTARREHGLALPPPRYIPRPLTHSLVLSHLHSATSSSLGAPILSGGHVRVQSGNKFPFRENQALAGRRRRIVARTGRDLLYVTFADSFPHSERWWRWRMDRVEGADADEGRGRADPRRSRFRHCYNNPCDLSDRRAFYCAHLKDQPDVVASSVSHAVSLSSLLSFSDALQI